MISAAAALRRLEAGNRRFVDGSRSEHALPSEARRRELAEGQNPFAIVLGCSDSRVPAEIVFDQGVGDLFVVRVAGNVAAPSQIGSIEFAAEQFGTRLVVVLGHSGCGAIIATLEAMERPAVEASPNLLAIVDRVRPAVAGLVESDLRSDRALLLDAAVRANVEAAVAQVQRDSPVIRRLIADEGLRVVGAEYSLETGVVELFAD